MKYYIKQLVILFFVLFLGLSDSSAAQAAEVGANKSLRYITDRQTVRIRSGRSPKDKIIKNVRSGTPLELLDQQGKYSQVRTKSGLTGWILSIYLQKQTISKDKLKEISKLYKKAQALNLEKDISISKLTSREQKLRQSYQQLEGSFTSLQSEHKQLQLLAEDAINITAKNNTLNSETESLQNQLETLQAEVSTLADDSRKEWFINGAGVILAGVLIGLVLPMLRKKSRSSW